MEISKIQDFFQSVQNLEGYSIDDHTGEMRSIIKQGYLLLTAHIGSIYENGKYKERYNSIEEWAGIEFNWERTQLHNYVKIYKLLKTNMLDVEHRSTLPAPNSMRQALYLTKQNIDSEDFKEVYQNIYSREKVTYSIIDEEIKKYLESKRVEEAIKQEDAIEEPEIESVEWDIQQEPKSSNNGETEEQDVEQIKRYWLLDEWNDLMIEERLSIIECLSESESKFNTQDTQSIEWARWSWNPITGCKHECSYCYARDIANRFYEQGFEPSFYPQRLSAPENTEVPIIAETDISYKNVFTCSMADLFGRWVPAEWIEVVLNSVRENSQWNFLFLTKFPKRMAEFDIPQNAWMGTTVDCQVRVEAAEKAFRQVNCDIKWISVEPMLEDIKFNNLEIFDWVVMGGSSASSSTPAWAPPFDWVVNLHNQARAAGCMVYQKTNLFSGNNGENWLSRLKEWPGETPETRTLPDQFKYMKSIK